MIKFFRGIRKKIVMQNMSGRYLKYALGEIILVVIGILIALQINNWNESRKQLIKEQQILKSLREEFKQNIRELEFDHNINLGCIKAIVTLINFDETKDFKTSTIDSLIGKSFNFATFDARLGVMNDITASGNLDLIRNENLRYVLNQWTGELEDYKEDIIIRREYWINNIPRITYKYIPIRNTDAYQNRADYQRDILIEPMNLPKSNYERFLTELEVDNMLFDYYMNQSFVTTNEERIMSFLRNTLELIEQSIE